MSGRWQCAVSSILPDRLHAVDVKQSRRAGPRLIREAPIDCLINVIARDAKRLINRESIDDVALMVDDYDHVHEGHSEDDALLIGTETVNLAGVSVGDKALDALGLSVERRDAVPRSSQEFAVHGNKPGESEPRSALKRAGRSRQLTEDGVGQFVKIAGRDGKANAVGLFSVSADRPKSGMFSLMVDGNLIVKAVYKRHADFVTQTDGHCSLIPAPTPVRRGINIPELDTTWSRL